MNKQKWILLVVTLALMAGTGTIVARYKSLQKLGKPGVKTTAVADSIRLRVEVPEQVLDYQSEWRETDETTLKALPADTSFGQRAYTAPDGFKIQFGAVMMGTDRTSLHKPQFCLRAVGFNLLATEPKTVPVQLPFAYELPVNVITAVPANGPANVRGVYVYWFVSEDKVTSEHWQRMWWMARDLVTTGVLQRWTYLYCFATCEAGQETAALERLRTFVGAAVPEFHLATPKGGTSAAAQSP
jgi:hypothetical protein